MIVIFHSQDGETHCDDGFTAAWVFRRRYGNDVQVIPGVYGTEPPLERCAREHVVLADFSYKRPAMRALIETAAMVTVLDHHKTAEAELAGLQDEYPDIDETGMCRVLIRFDMDRSGAGLAWDYCFPGEPPPDLLLRIEDGDLWRWQYEDGKAVQAALRSYPQDFDVWADLMSRPIAELAAEGAAIRRFIEAKVTELKRTAWVAEVGGVAMPVCNAPWFLASELAGQLAEEHDGGRAAVYFEQQRRRVFSLRARGDADVSEIAKKFGGGGHKSAAGFEVPRP